MARIATSIEESQKLLELGIDKSSADMRWYREQKWFPYELQPYPYNESIITDGNESMKPAWSLGALIIIISNIEPQRFSFVFCSDVDNWVGDFIEYGYGRKITRMDDDLISLCVNMIKGLVNEGYIKGKEDKE